MAEQYYQTEKLPLSTPEGVSPLNKKTNSDYMIDNDCFNEREDNPSPEEHPNPPQPISPEEYVVEHPSVVNTVDSPTTTPANKPFPQPQSVVYSFWNPEHPNPFFPLEEPLDFEDLIIADSDPRYNIFTVESMPESPTSKKQGDYTHVIDLDREQTSSSTCKLD
ncbi:hypothetical protein DSO57_1007927 [Entomophthora muscae]|uniref:Uncharacterized protein n=1 Tax=Entomophthora muscae TaxID=34485 RepID=A0ACC2U5G0_9FUNG|nr:hypothetical protein DSO57_1007927 [Entomophthora muscae]